MFLLCYVMILLTWLFNCVRLRMCSFKLILILIRKTEYILMFDSIVQSISNYMPSMSIYMFDNYIYVQWFSIIVT